MYVEKIGEPGDEASKTHNEAVRTTRNIGELLSTAHAAQRQQARDMLRSSIRFLARQRLGDGSDSSANLIQLLRLRAEDKPKIVEWLDRSARKHTSPENQNEILEIMAHRVLRKILEDIHYSPFLAVMVDETTDKFNKEQLTGGSVKSS